MVFILISVVTTILSALVSPEIAQFKVICKLFLFLQPQPTGAIAGVFATNLVAKDTPGISNINFELIDVDNDQFVNTNITLLKRIDFQIMMNFGLLKIEGKTTKRLFQAPKFNYCAFRRHGDSMPVVSDVFKAVAASGTFAFNCPAEPGTYTMRNFSISKIPMLSIIPTGKNMLLCELIDENSKSKPVLIYRYKLYFQKN
jgi:Protein of unknown function (DUF1091)